MIIFSIATIRALTQTSELTIPSLFLLSASFLGTSMPARPFLPRVVGAGPALAKS